MFFSVSLYLLISLVLTNYISNDGVWISLTIFMILRALSLYYIINDNDKFFYKSPFADITMGLNTNINFKNWDFAMVTRASLGNYAYDNVASSTAYQRRATENSILTNLHSDYLDTGFVNITENNLLSSHYVKNGSTTGTFTVAAHVRD